MSLADLPLWAAWSLLSGFILFGFWLLTWGEDKQIQTPTPEDFEGEDDL